MLHLNRISQKASAEIITETYGSAYLNQIAKNVKNITVFINDTGFKNTNYWQKILNILLLELKRFNIECYLYIVDGFDYEASSKTDRRLASDGYIFIGIMPKSLTKLAHELAVPYISIDMTFTIDNCPNVSADNMSAGRKAAEMFIAHGHRRLAFMGGIDEYSSYRKRFQGFEKYINENKDLIDSLRLVDDRIFNMFNVSVTEVRDIMSKPDRPTAIFCSSDVILPRLKKILDDVGLMIPHNVAVISFDNLDLNADKGMNINSFHVSKIDMALSALYQLFVFIDRKTVGNNLDLIIEATLVDRGSVIHYI